MAATAPGLALPGAKTPWRTITLGELSIKTTVSFDVVKPLYEASGKYEYGRGSWSWIIGMDGSTKYEEQLRYIDFSAAMGYQSVLVHALWGIRTRLFRFVPVPCATILPLSHLPDRPAHRKCLHDAGSSATLFRYCRAVTESATPEAFYLRTHTSSVQTRVMEVSQPPIRIICPGRVYRNEAISYRAHCFFHQVEALYVDKDVSFTDLKQVLLLFAKEMFGEDTKIRLRPSYFPFTEPSAEMDISCNICGGKGCPFCKHTGWVEILGCGMVDPNVLESNGIDSKVYSGYALGMGIERITNLKYQVKDLRMFSENDTRFLKEFEAAY